VIRVDLLGHGGSGQPSSGYGIDQQAQAISEALGTLRVGRATIVGHSLGGSVATALAEKRPDLAARLVIIATPADPSRSALSFLSRLTHAPVIGQAIKTNIPYYPASWVRDNYRQAFAPGFDLAEGFDRPDQVLDDIRAMTHAAYAQSWSEYRAYGQTKRLDQRVAGMQIPLLALFGELDEIKTNQSADIRDFRTVPGAEVAVLSGIGHSPQIEAPAETARMICEFIERCN
jgi:pimeloyl-ACP methyl ester carboxylesterase